MKSMICFFLILLMALICAPAKAQEPLVLYDDFNSGFMDVGKWVSSESRGDGVILLETVREIHGNRLLLVARAFGNTVSNPTAPFPQPRGTRPGDVNAAFGVTEVFQSLKVSVKVNQAQATGCPDFNATPTAARARLIAFYFNATNPAATPGNRTGDVLAQLRIQRASNSTDKSQILEIWFEVLRCTNSGCGSASSDGLPIVYLGKINLGQWATIQIDWDGVRYFNAKIDEAPAEQIDIQDATIPGGDGKWSLHPVSSRWNALGVSNRLAADCPANERATGYVEAEFDNLFVRSFP